MTVARRLVSSQMNYGGFPCAYHSALDVPQGPGANARLTIRLRIRLSRMSAAARGWNWTHTTDRCGKVTHQTVPIREWGDAEWQLFLEECLEKSGFWAFRFYLTPPEGYGGLDAAFGAARFRPHVECRFEPQLVGSGGAPHVRYEVARVADSVDQPYRASFAEGAGERAKMTSNTGPPGLAGLLNSQTHLARIMEVPDDKGTVWKTLQSAWPHELGHALGLPHSGTLAGDPEALAAEARGGTCVNSGVTYGVGRPGPLADNIMGVGSAVSEMNAAPWAQRVGMHLRHAPPPPQWKVTVRKDGMTLQPRRL